LDSAQVLSASSSHLLRNALIGGAVGLVLGLLVALALQGGRVGEETGGVPEGAMRALRKRESQLEQRIKTVSARERQLARRAGELASRERELALTPEEPAKPSEEVPAVESPPVPATLGGAWNIQELQRVVDAKADASPEQAEEWRAYLYFLREHASADGTLPPGFSGLVEEVFAELFEDRRSSAR
jgi:hypothetical protein